MYSSNCVYFRDITRQCSDHNLLGIPPKVSTIFNADQTLKHREEGAGKCASYAEFVKGPRGPQEDSRLESILMAMLPFWKFMKHVSG